MPVCVDLVIVYFALSVLFLFRRKKKKKVTAEDQNPMFWQDAIQGTEVKDKNETEKERIKE